MRNYPSTRRTELRLSRQTNRPLTVVSLLLGLFLAAMEMTVVSTAMPTAVGDLGGIHLYAWVFAAYMLTATVTLPIHGKLADLYGRKPVMLVGLALFLSGSFLCGHAASMNTLILFRAIQGLGAGAIQPIAMTIVGDLFDVHQRARIQGILGAVWGLAGLIGPVLGGAIVHWLSWRWVFYVNIPLGLGCAAVLIFAYHEKVERQTTGSISQGRRSFPAPWCSRFSRPAPGRKTPVFCPRPRRAGPLPVGRTRADEPLLPLDLFSRRVMAVASATGALIGAAMISVVTFVPLYVQSVLAGSPTDAGTAIAPIAIGWPVSSTLAGRMLPRTGYRSLIRGGLALTFCAALGLSFLLRPAVLVVASDHVLLWAGIGVRQHSPGHRGAVERPWKRRGVATASTMFSRSIGGTLPVGVLGGVLAAALAAGGAPPGAVDNFLGRSAPSSSGAGAQPVRGAAGGNGRDLPGCGRNHLAALAADLSLSTTMKTHQGAHHTE